MHNLQKHLLVTLLLKANLEKTLNKNILFFPLRLVEKMMYRKKPENDPETTNKKAKT